MIGKLKNMKNDIGKGLCIGLCGIGIGIAAVCGTIALVSYFLNK